MNLNTITYASSVDQTAPLLADVCYRADATLKPLLLVMHGYQGTRQAVRQDLEELAALGVFAVAPDMRGRGDSAGQWDSGGLDVHDVIDAAKVCTQRFASEIDASNLNIVGYSGGGGNAISAGCRFPDLFNVVASFFGIADYARWYASGQLSDSNNNKTMNQVLGGPAQAPDRYDARNMVRAAGNVKATRWYLFWDREEAICPPGTCVEPWIHAYRAAGGQRLRCAVSEPRDAIRWLHGYRSSQPALSHGDDLYLPDVMRQPTDLALPPQGELIVPGYLVTRHFTVMIGDGTQGWARIRYRLGKTPEVEVCEQSNDLAVSIQLPEAVDAPS